MDGVSLQYNRRQVQRKMSGIRSKEEILVRIWNNLTNALVSMFGYIDGKSEKDGRKYIVSCIWQIRKMSRVDFFLALSMIEFKRYIIT